MGRLMRGIFTMSGNYEPTIAAPLDARTVVEYKSDLTNSTTWASDRGAVYLYRGLMVAVVSDTEENNGIYFLRDSSQYTLIDSWIKIADQTAIDTLNERIDEIEISGGGSVITVETKASLPNIGDTTKIYIVTSENATYRWDDTGLMYYCVGRDYNEISVINGGEAVEQNIGG